MAKRPQGLGKPPKIEQEDSAPASDKEKETAPSEEKEAEVPKEKGWYFKTVSKRRDDGKMVQLYTKMRLVFRPARRIPADKDRGFAAGMVPGITLDFGDRDHGPPGSYIVREGEWGQPGLPEGDPRANLPTAQEVADFILSHPYYAKMGYITQVGLENQRLLEQKKRELAILTAKVTGDTSMLAEVGVAPNKPTIVRGVIHTPAPLSEYAEMPAPYPLEVNADALPTRDIPGRE